MPPPFYLLLSSLLTTVYAQKVGTLTSETHPALAIQTCTTAGGCVTKSAKIVLDANWRWLHSTSGYANCYTGNSWDSTLCPDPATCAANCAIEGVDYSGTFGVTTSGNALTLKFATAGTNANNFGSRVFLMANDTLYQSINPLTQEIAFDVDVSRLPCGLNGAVYLTGMDADGGLSKYPGNKAGAKYGTGYCDSKCPRDLKFINGQANVVGWTASPISTSSGTGEYGSCCNEMDLWEANSISTDYLAHPCSVTSQYRCSGEECGVPDRYDSVCDADGCDYNPYRLGNPAFYGPGKTVDTSAKFTVVTQFLTDDGTTSGNLAEVRRYYVQKGKVIQNSKVNIPTIPATYDSMTDKFCAAEKTSFGEVDEFSAKGGFKTVGDAMKRGMVLAFNIKDDPATNMLWLDSAWPLTADASTPGVLRGTCSTSSGAVPQLEVIGETSSVVFSNIRFGDLGSTTPGFPATSSSLSVAPSTTATKSATTTTTSAAPLQSHYGQCGGTGYTGPTVCISPYVCTYANVRFSQCL